MELRNLLMRMFLAMSIICLRDNFHDCYCVRRRTLERRVLHEPQTSVVDTRPILLRPTNVNLAAALTPE